jgi:hypothetical protein
MSEKDTIILGIVLFISFACEFFYKNIYIVRYINLLEDRIKILERNNIAEEV